MLFLSKQKKLATVLNNDLKGIKSTFILSFVFCLVIYLINQNMKLLIFSIVCIFANEINLHNAEVLIENLGGIGWAASNQNKCK